MYQINFRLIFLILFIPLFIGCGVSGKHWQNVEKMMMREQYSEADKYVDAKKDKEYGKRNVVLYYLDRALILHHAGKYKESNELLDKCERLMEELYTKSVSTAAASLTTSDNIIPYEGEDHEKVLVNMLWALNYALMGNFEEALVEGRKVDNKLQLLRDRYAEENKKAKNPKEKVDVAYTEDAFIRYFMGILNEANGEINEAFIFYRQAYETYQNYLNLYGTPIPPMLKEDILRTAHSLDFRNEYDQFQKEFNTKESLSEKDIAEKGTLVLIHYNGLGPYKDEFSINVAIPSQVNLVRVALPTYKERSFRIDHAEIEIDSTTIGKTYIGEDITKIAIRNLKDRYPRILKKTIARLVVKEAAKYGLRKASDSDNQTVAIAGFIAYIGYMIFGAATEQADKRSFRLLPAEIHLGKAYLDPGTYDVTVYFKDKYGNDVETKTYKSITLEKGKAQFIAVRTYT